METEFLRQIEDLRLRIARAVYTRGADLSAADLHAIVHTILIRSLFARIAGNSSRAGIFADDDRMSGVYIEDKELREIIESLFSPDFSRFFDRLPADILGSVYEHFLGKAIRVTADQIRAEETPAAKKASGAYYTPRYIVEYIVRNTVGEKIGGKSLREIEHITICDPACGVGSFLMGAYAYLLEYHFRYYTRAENLSAAAACGKIRATRSGAYALSMAEKQRILTHSIFGVDIDPLAAEICRLSLYLQLIEDEEDEGDTAATGQSRLASARFPVANIRCGNSLITAGGAPAFAWEAAFPEVCARGGFDCVIGNPPYIEFKRLDAKLKIHLERYYQSARGKYDLYIPFIEKSIQLLNPTGVSSFIVPSMFTKRDYGRFIRQFITSSASIQAMTYFGDFQVFRGVTVFPLIFFFSKKKTETAQITVFPAQKNLTHEKVARALNPADAAAPPGGIARVYRVRADSFGGDAWIAADDAAAALRKKIENNPKVVRLRDIARHIFVGIASGKDEVFYINEETRDAYNIEKEILFPILKGRDIHKYRAQWSGAYCLYPYALTNNAVIQEKEFQSRYPNAYAYLTEKKELLRGRGYFDRSVKLWYELWCERKYAKFHQPKIVNAEIAAANSFYLDEEFYLGNTKVFSTVLRADWSAHYLYVLGILNSGLLEFVHRQISVPKAGGFFEYKTQFLNLYPIRVIDFSNAAEQKAYAAIARLASRLLALNKDFRDFKKPHTDIAPGGIASLKTQIRHYEDQIDALVYALYGLTDEEIALAEERG